MHPDRHYTHTHTHIGKLFQAVSTQAPEGIAVQDSLTLLDAVLDMINVYIDSLALLDAVLDVIDVYIGQFSPLRCSVACDSCSLQFNPIRCSVRCDSFLGQFNPIRCSVRCSVACDSCS